MTDTTCKRTACEVVSPLIAGQPTFCSKDCENISTAVFGPRVAGPWSWLGDPAPDRAGKSSGGWPS